MKFTIWLILCFLTISTYAQIDTMFFHSGNVVPADVKKIDETTIVYSYAGEELEILTSKLSVEKIIYRSGRVEDISEKIEITGEEDWEKVIILYDKSETVGLKKVQDIQAKTKGFFSYFTSGAGSDRRASEKFLIEAAKLKCPFVLLLVDKDAKGGLQGGAYGNQSLKKGAVYSY